MSTYRDTRPISIGTKPRVLPLSRSFVQYQRARSFTSCLSSRPGSSARQRSQIPGVFSVHLCKLDHCQDRQAMSLIGKRSSHGGMSPQRSSRRIDGRYAPTRHSRVLHNGQSTNDVLQLANTVPDTRKLHRFLSDVLPPVLGDTKNQLLKNIKTREQFIEDASAALKLAPMAIRLTPHLLSAIDWNNPLDDPVRRQFLPLASGIVPDHQKLTLDSLNEQEDSRAFCVIATESSN